MENLYTFSNPSNLVAKKLDIKFGLGSAILIGKLENWFRNIFEVNDPVGFRLRQFEILSNSNYENTSILIILLENEWGVFYELLKQFCFQYGFGGIEEELSQALKKWRKGRKESSFLGNGYVQHQKDGVGKVLKINHTLVTVLLTTGERKEYKIEELISLYLGGKMKILLIDCSKTLSEAFSQVLKNQTKASVIIQNDFGGVIDFLEKNRKNIGLVLFNFENDGWIPLSKELKEKYPNIPIWLRFSRSISESVIKKSGVDEVFDSVKDFEKIMELIKNLKLT